MIDYILEKFTDITSKCLEREAKKCSTEKKNMQLVFKLGADENAEYVIYKDYNPICNITFLQVLGVKLDFKGYSLFVPTFIKGALNRFCESHNIEKDKVRVILTFNEKNEMILWLYNNTQYVTQVVLEDMFDSQDMLIEQ
jgi:hypothetical protein